MSTDLSHYLDYATAERRDLATAGTIERLDYTTLGPMMLRFQRAEWRTLRRFEVQLDGDAPRFT